MDVALDAGEVEIVLCRDVRDAVAIVDEGDRGRETWKDDLVRLGILDTGIRVDSREYR